MRLQLVMLLAAGLPLALAVPAPVAAQEGYAGYELWRELKNGKYGYTTGTPRRTVIPFQFDWAGDFVPPGLAPARQDGRFGVVDTLGRWRVPPRYDYAYPGAHGMHLVAEDGKFGAVDDAGSLRVPLEYEYLGGFNAAGVSTAVKGDRWGVIDRTGAIRVPLECSLIPLAESGWSECLQGRNRRIYRPDGTLFDDGTRFQTVTAPLGSKYVDATRTDGRHVLVNYAGEEVLTGNYSRITYYPEYDVALVADARSGGLYHVGRRAWMLPMGSHRIAVHGAIAVVRSYENPRGPFRLFDLTGRVTFAGEYDELATVPTDVSGLLALRRGDRWGILSRQGREVVPFELLRSPVFMKNGRIAGRKRSGWGITDHQGRILLPFDFTHTTAVAPGKDEPHPFFSLDLGGVGQEVRRISDDTQAILGPDLRWIVEPGVYDEIGSFVSTGRYPMAIVKRDGRLGIYDVGNRREILAPGNYRSIEDKGDGALVRRHGAPDALFGYPTLRLYTHPKLHITDYAPESHALVVRDAQGRQGLVGANGQNLTNLEYERLFLDFTSRLFQASGARTGFLRQDGGVAVPFAYDTIWVPGLPPHLDYHFFFDGSRGPHVSLRQNGRWRLVDTAGRVLVREEDFVTPQMPRPQGRPYLREVNLGQRFVYAADFKTENDSSRLRLLIDGKVYETPGGDINNVKDAIELKEGLLPVRRNGRFCFLDLEGTEAIPCRFERAGAFYNGIAPVKENGQYKLINRWGEPRSFLTTVLVFLIRSGR